MGWSAGRHVDHPCGGQISPWPAGKVTEFGSVDILVACLRISTSFKVDSFRETYQ